MLFAFAYVLQIPTVRTTTFSDLGIMQQSDVCCCICCCCYCWWCCCLSQQSIHSEKFAEEKIYRHPLYSNMIVCQSFESCIVYLSDLSFSSHCCLLYQLLNLLSNPLSVVCSFFGRSFHKPKTPFYFPILHFIASFISFSFLDYIQFFFFALLGRATEKLCTLFVV